VTTIVDVPRRRAGGSGSTIRVLVAIESTRDRALLSALQNAAPVAGGAFLVTRRCMTAEQLCSAVLEDQADAVLVGEGLFGLDAATLGCCVDAGVPTLVLGTAPCASKPGLLELPSEVAPSQVCAVLAAAVWGTSEQLGETLRAAGGAPPEPATERARRGRGDNPDRVAPVRLGPVVVVVGPPRGNVGASRGAIELAAARERHQATLLVDAVLDEPSVAAGLGLNPARNLTVLAASVGSTATPERWMRLLREETQPLDQQHPRAAVLAGVPSPSLRHRVEPDFLVELIGHASGPAGFGCVVVDAGAEPPAGSLEGACWRAVVELADRVLLVAMPDIVGLRRALGTLERLAARVERERLGVVLNRYRRGEHDDAADIATVLGGVPVVAVVPDDVRACTRALRLQRPLMSLGRSGAGRELRRLADHLHVTPSPTRTQVTRQRARWWGWRRR
jgi:MinD-like ATPase involved in chromosome partitioning or flagellar assembly